MQNKYLMIILSSVLISSCSEGISDEVKRDKKSSLITPPEYSVRPEVSNKKRPDLEEVDIAQTAKSMKKENEK